LHSLPIRRPPLSPLFPYTTLFRSVFAQLPTGTILGVVKDSSGAVIPGASVTITNIDNSLTRTGASTEDGSYRFPALPVGHYRLEDRKSTRLNSSHVAISYAVFCLK